MKLELCSFSGAKILPGHGKKYVKMDGKVYHFMSGKCARSHMMKRNPRKIAWTVLYRRKHKKGTSEEVVKKRTRRTVKHARAIQGASLQEILMKKNQKPEVRKAQREQAIRSAKAKATERKEHQRAQKVQQRATQSRQPKAKLGKVPKGGGGKGHR